MAEPLYLAGYIERMGTGTGDMIRRCREAGLPSPGFRQDGGMFVQTIWRPMTSTRQVEGEVALPVTPPVAPPVASPVAKLMAALGEQCEMGNQELREHFGLRDRRHLREHYVDPAIAEGLVEMTIPDKPTSRLQKYRLTEKGRAWVAELAHR